MRHIVGVARPVAMPAVGYFATRRVVVGRGGYANESFLVRQVVDEAAVDQNYPRGGVGAVDVGGDNSDGVITAHRIDKRPVCGRRQKTCPSAVEQRTMPREAEPVGRALDVGGRVGHIFVAVDCGGGRQAHHRQLCRANSDVVNHEAVIAACRIHRPVAESHMYGLAGKLAQTNTALVEGRVVGMRRTVVVDGNIVGRVGIVGAGGGQHIVGMHEASVARCRLPFQYHLFVGVGRDGDGLRHNPAVDGVVVAE